MPLISFTVTNTTTVSNEVVVVSPFIADADQNASLAEWRVLAPAPNGGSAQFTYAGAIAASVSDGSASTAAVAVQLGQLLSVTSTQTGGLQLALAGNGRTANQAFVRNDSTDPSLLIVTWGRRARADRGWTESGRVSDAGSDEHAALSSPHGAGRAVLRRVRSDGGGDRSRPLHDPTAGGGRRGDVVAQRPGRQGRPHVQSSLRLSSGWRRRGTLLVRRRKWPPPRRLLKNGIRDGRLRLGPPLMVRR